MAGDSHDRRRLGDMFHHLTRMVKGFVQKSNQQRFSIDNRCVYHKNGNSYERQTSSNRRTESHGSRLRDRQVALTIT